jgi:uncharacterized damage-inducible protein DinB
MREPSDAVREHLVRALEWEDAHVGFERSLADLPAGLRGVRPPGFDHSCWELLEHLRIAQDDILEFCLDAKYVHTRAWPADYWPATPAPPGAAEWEAAITACLASRGRLAQVAREVDDLTALVPTGEGPQTYLRALLLAADHVAYHVGQIVSVRRALGAW